MKILVIFSSPCGLNGAALNLGTSIRALVAHGHEVVVLCLRPDAASRHFAEGGARLLFFDLPLGMNTTLLLESSAPSLFRVVVQNLKDVIRAFVGFPLTLQLIGRERPDALFLMDVTFPQCALAGFIRRLPVVCEVQEQLIRGRFGLRRRALVALYRRCARMFGITAEHLRPLLALGQDKNWAVTIPNTISIPAGWSPGDSDVLKGAEGRELLLYAGGVNANKGHDFLLQVLARLVQRRPQVLLIFAGGFGEGYESPYARGTVRGQGRETARLFTFIEQHHLRDHVRLVGMRPDILDVMAACHGVLVPHRTPHFSRPIIEAFALKVPVLASRDAFNAALIQDDATGLLADYGNHEEWVLQAERLLSDAALRARVTEGGNRVYRERFDPNVVERAIVELFESIPLSRER